jgi:hypothetical protein
MDLPREGILYSVLTYLGGWAVWVALCIKITPDLPKIQVKTINSVPEFDILINSTSKLPNKKEIQ